MVGTGSFDMLFDKLKQLRKKVHFYKSEFKQMYYASLLASSFLVTIFITNSFMSLLCMVIGITLCLAEPVFREWFGQSFDNRRYETYKLIKARTDFAIIDDNIEYIEELLKKID